MRDANGKVLKDLPKPNQSDDKTLATDAVNLFKQLKKDVRAIASQQIDRLEQAMCQRRRWTAEQFRLFLVEHPLVRHLTRRLLWGVYTEENTLIACFRVAEDSTYSDAQDELFTLPAGNIGIPHVLEIPLNPPLHSGKFTLITNCFPLSNSSNVVVTTLLITNVMSMNCHAGTDVSAVPDAL